MKNAKYVVMFFKSCLEILRYELLSRVCGIGWILRELKQLRVSRVPFTQRLERDVCDAVLLATCFHWKPVLCLQRSVCTARLLKRCGIDAHVVIGYRSSPFFSHAWVEVDGRVIYGSPACKRQLQPLFVS